MLSHRTRWGADGNRATAQTRRVATATFLAPRRSAWIGYNYWRDGGHPWIGCSRVRFSGSTEVSFVHRIY